MALFYWRVRGPFGVVEIELHPQARVDAETREASGREVKRLVHDFVYRQPEASRLVLELYGHIHGLTSNAGSVSHQHLDVGSPLSRAIGEALLAAARAGRLVARRRDTRSVVVPLDGVAEDVLGPDPNEPPPDSKSWVGLTLVDQDGTPVPNRPYRVIKPDGTTLDGLLDSNATAIIKELDPGNCQIWCPYAEPHPELSYTVKDGDHTSGVAESFGFDDYTVVWNDPGNADLQTQRTDPHVLVPGDALTIPELKAQAAANKPTGAKHPFKIQRSPLKLRLTLLDLAVKPVPDAQVTVAGNALTADGNGLVEATVDKGVKDVPMIWSNDTLDLKIGALNPSDDTTEAGYKARLVNMGFLWDPMADDAEDEMLVALQDFQAQYKLQMSGQLDDATKAQLLTSYGC